MEAEWLIYLQAFVTVGWPQTDQTKKNESVTMCHISLWIIRFPRASAWMTPSVEELSCISGPKKKRKENPAIISETAQAAAHWCIPPRFELRDSFKRLTKGPIYITCFHTLQRTHGPSRGAMCALQIHHWYKAEATTPPPTSHPGKNKIEAINKSKSALKLFPFQLSDRENIQCPIPPTSSICLLLLVERGTLRWAL